MLIAAIVTWAEGDSDATVAGGFAAFCGAALCCLPLVPIARGAGAWLP